MDGFLSMTSALQAQKQTYTIVEGVIQAGSYDSKHGTVQVMMGHTVGAASFPDTAGQPINPVPVGAKLAVMGYGMQYGPIGGERCLLIRCATHSIALIEYAEDDSPGAPLGETWALHRVPTSPTTINASWKLTNDGATAGDGLGGYKVLAGGQGNIATAGGISLVLDDTANKATLSAGSGLGLIIDKGAAKVTVGGGGTTAIQISTSGSTSIAMSTTQMTFNGATASTANGIARQSDLVALLAAIQSAITSWAASSLQGGSGASGPSFAGIIPTASSASFTS